MVPASWRGFRTLFSSLHHFRPAEARALLAAARDAGVGLAAFEATQRSVPAVMATLLLPVAALLAMPFIRPRRASRFVFTYLVPVLPLAIWWDGVVSCLRTYTVSELQRLADGLGGDRYRWHASAVRNQHTPFPITFLIGEPVAPAAERRP